MSNKRKQIESLTQEETSTDHYFTEEPAKKKKTEKPHDELLAKVHRIFHTDDSTLIDSLRGIRRDAYYNAKPEGLLCYGIKDHIKKGPQSLLAYMEKSFADGNPIVAIAYSSPAAVLEDMYAQPKYYEQKSCRILLKKSEFWYYVFNTIRDQLDTKSIQTFEQLKHLVQQLWDEDSRGFREAEYYHDGALVKSNAFSKNDDFEYVWKVVMALWQGEKLVPEKKDYTIPPSTKKLKI